jgi:peptide deformylase
MQLNIELLGSPILRKRAVEILTIDEELRLLIDDMFETMYAAEGIGLAGPQVGVAKRVVVVDLKDEGASRFALVNPKIVESGTPLEKEEEGCLSIPGVASQVERPSRVVVEAVDEHGHPLHIEAEGLLARCLQHEIDHLNGVLFIDHLSALKRSMLLKKYRQLQEEEKKESMGKVPARRAT